MLAQLRVATLMLAALTLLTGGIYPLIITAVARSAFPRQADGSLIPNGDRLLGSELIGQPFTKPGYFWGRLSATSPAPYNAGASSGSNFGPLNPELKKAAAARIDALKAADPSTKAGVPVDLATASASGLDPHISPAAAEWQVARVAKARGLTEDAVRALVHSHTEGRQFGVLGEPRVNVLGLNLALDQLDKRK